MEVKVKIPQEVLDAILKIRSSGETNMFNLYRVQRIAFESGEYAAVVWLEEHKKEYPQIIMGNFQIEG